MAEGHTTPSAFPPTEEEMEAVNAQVHGLSEVWIALHPNATAHERAAQILHYAFDATSELKISISTQFITRTAALQWISANDSSGNISQMVLACRDRKDYKSLLHHPLLNGTADRTVPPLNDVNKTPRNPDAEILKDAQVILSDLKARLLLVISGEKKLPSWTPASTSGSTHTDFIASLEIPTINNRPCLLLHKLGVDSQFDSSLGAVFTHRHATCMLYDSPGRGKTRTLLEGLCRDYGLYFACATSEGLASRDLQEVLSTLELSGRFKIASTDNHGVIDPAVIASNEAVVTHRIHEILLARLVVMKLFLEISSPPHATITESARKRMWTLLQIAPVSDLLDGTDFFETLSLNYRPASSNFLRGQITTTHSWIENTIQSASNQHRLFVIVDEAQRAAALYENSFVSQDYTKPRPVLRQIIRALRAVPTFNPTLIISGTALSKRSIETAIDSSESKPANIVVVTQKGDFSAAGPQEKYISKYFPASYLKSPEGTHLLVRLFRWVPGRYRFTASFIELALLDGFKRPHKALDMYVRHMTSYTPVDCLPEFAEAAPLPLDPVVPPSFRLFNFDRLNALPKKDQVIQYIYNCICYYLMDEPFVMDAPPSLVETSFAYVLKDSEVARIAEPLPLLALAHWLEENHHQDFADHLAERMRDKGSRPYAFETIIPLYLSSALDDRTPLNQVFKFIGPEPAWASQTAALVSCNKGSNIASDSFKLVKHPYDDRTQPQLAARQRGKGASKRTQKWFENPNGIPFLFPDTKCGPDCFVLARLKDEQYVWIAMQMKAHETSEQISPSERKKAIRSVTPRYYCDALEKPAGLRKTMFANMQRLAHCEPDSFQVLRVVAAYPSLAGIERDPFPTPRED
ncbi:hypothetical protein EUX98_g7203, partial [Antrodiella citrinella]